MRYDRLFTKLYCRPLMLESSAFHGLERALVEHFAAFHATGEKKAGPMSGDQITRRVSRISEYVSPDTALLHMDGVIDKHISDFDMDCYGGYDLRDLDNAVSRLESNPDIRNVMLVVNSPGGSATGVPESAARVSRLADSKNVFAFTDGMMASAAYYIASQADQIFASPSADVGSIGVYTALLDATRAMEMEGLKVNFIKDGKYKGMGAPFKALTDKEREMFQSEVNDLGAMFRGAVTSKRSVDDSVMQGQTFLGARALDAGLIDAVVPDLAAALEHFQV